MAEQGVRTPRPGPSRREPNRPATAPAPEAHGTAPGSQCGDMAQELLDQMSAIRRTARRVAGNPAVLTDLTGSQLELVRIVRRRPGMSVADAAEELRLAPNTVSTLVGQLADAGIIVRTTDRDDRRVARLALDPLGSSTVVEGYDRRVEALASVLDRLSPNERRRLREAQAVLATVATLLEADATAAERASDRRHGRGRTTRRAEPGSAAHPQ